MWVQQREKTHVCLFTRVVQGIFMLWMQRFKLCGLWKMI